MNTFIQRLKKFGLQAIQKIDYKTQQPLLTNDDILELLHAVKNKNKAPLNKHDISFRKKGDVRSVYRGLGMDYEESRLYQPGDDPRYMNWQLSAKTGQHYMKVFREERQPGVFILIDRRYTMRFGTQCQLKITQAVKVAAMAAFSAQENNFSIGGVILDDELEWFKENQNKQSVFDFIHQAARPASPVNKYKPEEEQQPNISDVLRILNQVLTTGSTVYLISDFYDLDNTSQPILLQLSISYEVIAIHITDPAEIKLPKAGNISLKSHSSDTVVKFDTNTTTVQENYQFLANKYFSEKEKIFKDIAVSYQQISTTDVSITEKILHR